MPRRHGEPLSARLARVLCRMSYRRPLNGSARRLQVVKAQARQRGTVERHAV